MWAEMERMQRELGSLPTRGGWIEIYEEIEGEILEGVPPHTGRVD